MVHEGPAHDAASGRGRTPDGDPLRMRFRYIKRGRGFRLRTLATRAGATGAVGARCKAPAAARELRPDADRAGDDRRLLPCDGPDVRERRPHERTWHA